MGQFKDPSTNVKPRRVQKDQKVKKSKAVIRVPDISEALIKDKPFWIKLLLKLGYTANQAEVFAEVYTFHMVKLSKLVKKQATEMRCFTPQRSMVSLSYEQRTISKRRILSRL